MIPLDHPDNLFKAYPKKAAEIMGVDKILRDWEYRVHEHEPVKVHT